MNIGRIITLGALLAATAVLVGAFGAHAITDPKAKEWIETGFGQHMAHALAICVCGFVAREGQAWAKRAVWLFLLGIFLFSGSLYALALGAPRAIAMAAPIGGLSFVFGWLCLAWVGWRLGAHTNK